MHVLSTGESQGIVAIFSSLSPLKQSNRSETIFEMFLISMEEDSLTSLETNACSMAPASSLMTCWQAFDDRTDTSLCVMRLRRNLVIHLLAYSTFSR